MTNDEGPAFVLYVDHQGHPAPLGSSYHATASRRLTSSVDRHPPSSVTEVDSAYCPQCLSFHDTNTAGNLGYCPNATCRLCPICGSVASVAVEELRCFYKCGMCDWDSKPCQLVTSLDASACKDGEIDLEAVEKASTELLSQWEAKKEESNKEADDHFSNMQKTLVEIAKEHVKSHRSSNHRVSSSGLVTKRRQDGNLKGWSIEALEESQRLRKQEMESSMKQIVGGKSLQQIPLDDPEEKEELLYHPSFEGMIAETVLSQDTAHNMGLSKDMMLPLPIPLRPRKSRRCRAELAEGRPGILVKPKLNPLEGDSSLRTGHGQWWKKDSSAIEVLPRVRISSHASDGSRHVFLIKVSNPTLGVVRLRMVSSTYAGEYIWNSKTKTTKCLERLVVDPVKRIAIDAYLDTDVAKEIEATSLSELEPVEDSFLELGSKTTNNFPDAVAQWQAGSALSDSRVSTEEPATLRKLGQKKATAWFELVVIEPRTDSNVHAAVPISMELQVGDGSWESSLVQPRDSGSTESKDFVSFDLVILWSKIRLDSSAE